MSKNESINKYGLLKFCNIASLLKPFFLMFSE